MQRDFAGCAEWSENARSNANSLRIAHYECAVGIFHHCRATITFANCRAIVATKTLSSGYGWENGFALHDKGINE
jgi:hypothetical protein